MNNNEAAHADRKFLIRSLLLIVAVLVVGIVAISIWVHFRIQVTPEDKNDSRTNCIAWVNYYVPDAVNNDPATICKKAEQTDPRQFYRRWTRSNPIPIDPVPTVSGTPKPTDQ